jgi:phycocyanin-associated rod linker protein
MLDQVQPVKLCAKFTQSEAQVVIDAIYRQVLGTMHLVKRDRLISLESQLLNGQLSVRDFVRALAKSELYKSKFLYPYFQTKVIELNFKHLLGRAPASEAEVIEHLNRYQTQGYNRDIDSYIDSAEYNTHFGDATTPYSRHFFHPTAVLGTLSRSADSHLQETLDKTSVNGAKLPCLYRLQVANICLPGYGKMRHPNTEFVVPDTQLSETLQRIQRLGGTVVQMRVH